MIFFIRRLFYDCESAFGSIETTNFSISARNTVFSYPVGDFGFVQPGLELSTLSVHAVIVWVGLGVNNNSSKPRLF